MDDEDDGDDYRLLELFAAFTATPEAIAAGADPETRHYTLTWLTPGQLLAIARDLCEADERDGDPEAVLSAWLELRGDPA